MKQPNPTEDDEDFVIIEEVLQTEITKQPDPFKNEDYLLIKEELQPLLDDILFLTGKQDPKYQKFKQEISQWDKIFSKASLIAGKILSLDHSNPIESMFIYLALVESLGASIIHFLMLLLITYGYDYHIEQNYRVIHAETLDDLEQDHSLTPKIRFLEKHRLKRTSKLINVQLRNKIAHLNLTENDIDEDGNLSKNFVKNIQEKTQQLDKTLTFIAMTLAENKFWERLKPT